MDGTTVDSQWETRQVVGMWCSEGCRGKLVDGIIKRSILLGKNTTHRRRLKFELGTYIVYKHPKRLMFVSISDNEPEPTDPKYYDTYTYDTNDPNNTSDTYDDDDTYTYDTNDPYNTSDTYDDDARGDCSVKAALSEKTHKKAKTELHAHAKMAAAKVGAEEQKNRLTEERQGRILRQLEEPH